LCLVYLHQLKPITFKFKHYIKRTNYNSTILSASPSNETKQLYYFDSYSVGKVLSTFKKSAPHFLFKASGFVLLIRSSFIKSFNSF